RVLDRGGRAVARTHGHGRAAGAGRRRPAVLVRQAEHGGGRGGGRRRTPQDCRKGQGTSCGLAPMIETWNAECGTRNSRGEFTRKRRPSIYTIASIFTGLSVRVSLIV